MDSDLDWISHQALEALTGAHRTTVARWKRQARAGHLPAWLALLVNTVHRGRLDDVNAAWRGWMINRRDGELVTPEGVCVTQGQIRALPQLYELRRALEREVQALRAQLAVVAQVRLVDPLRGRVRRPLSRPGVGVQRRRRGYRPRAL